MNVKPFCRHLNAQKFGPILNKCEAKSTKIQSVYTSNVALQTHAERYVPLAECRILAPFGKTQQCKRSVCKRNAYPLQDQGCNDMDPVQCKRSPNGPLHIYTVCIYTVADNQTQLTCLVINMRNKP